MMSTQEQNTPASMKKHKPCYREKQFNRWIKEFGIPISMGVMGLLRHFNEFLWRNAKDRSKNPMQVQVTLFAIKKWVSRVKPILTRPILP